MTHEPGIVSNGRQRLYLLAIFKVDHGPKAGDFLNQGIRTGGFAGGTHAVGLLRNAARIS